MVCCGCGKSAPKNPTAKLAGQVTIDGQPIAEGRIDFFPTAQAGQPDGGPIVAGAYEVQRAPLGKVHVSFSAIRESGKILHERDHDFPERVNLIPPKFQTGIEVEVNGDNSALNFELKSK